MKSQVNTWAWNTVKVTKKNKSGENSFEKQYKKSNENEYIQLDV